MLGLRLDRSPRQAGAMLAGIVASCVFGFAFTGARVGNVLGTSSHEPDLVASVVYVAGTWAVYFVGHALVYQLGLHRALRRRLGPERAYTVYSTLLGIVFFNALWCQLPFLAALQHTLELGVPEILVLLTSATLLIGSFFIKLWATLHLGVDGYYYRDMFLEQRRTGGPITGGPYAIFSDPMYGVGYLPIYCGALFAFSVEGIVVAALFHGSINLFNLVVEKPFVLRTYGRPDASGRAVPQRTR